MAYLRAGSEPRRLTDLNADALGHIELAPLEETQVESTHDGRNIEAWIAKPPGFEADGSMPLLLEIHGGPFAMYGPSFAAEIQRYAAQGYVTVYVNPRGSTGYGEEFMRTVMAKTIADYVGLREMDAVQATEAGLAYLRRKVNGRGGVIVVDRHGRCASGFTTQKMIHGWIEHGGEAMARF